MDSTSLRIVLTTTARVTSQWQYACRLGPETAACTVTSAALYPSGGSVNAVAAVTHSAVYYVARCLLGEDVPSNDGCFRPVTLQLPEASVVSATPPHAVSAGNVETSQRITDVVLGALAQALPGVIPAASSGTMNNLTIRGPRPA